MRGTRARTQLRARSARPARSLRSLANTPARLRSQAPPARCAVNTSVVARAHSGALLLPPRSRQAAPLRPQINLQAPLHSPPSALIGCRPAIARLHIVYRLSRCVARSLRSLAIRRSSRSSQAPRGNRVVPSLPLLDHRHYGDGLLARYRLHISLLVPRRGRRAPGDSGCHPRARGCALTGAALAFARAKVCLHGPAVSRRYRLARCRGPALSIASGTLLRSLTFLCVPAPQGLLKGAKRPPSS